MNFIFFHEICIFMYSRNGRDRFYFYANCSKDDLFHRERERERGHVVSLRTIDASCRDVLAFIEMVSSRAHCKY